MKPLIIIAGPTAAGKSACAMEIADITGGEIVSADSMQVYKYMDIGTAKPSKDDMRRARHHLIDVVEPDFPFSAAQYVRMAKMAIKDIHLRGKIPILTGGTGFYINALIYHNDFLHPDSGQKPDSSNAIRSMLYNLYEVNGKEYMFEILKSIDPEYAETTHMNNIKRVLRAIEYYNETGEKFSEYNSRNKANRKPAFDLSTFIIFREREELYEIINRRVDFMFKAGLEAEVRRLVDDGYAPELTSMQGLGYKEIYSYIAGECDLNEACDNLKQGTRRFAKRQLTWFKNQIVGNWINITEYKDTKETAKKILSMSKI